MLRENYANPRGLPYGFKIPMKCFICNTTFEAKSGKIAIIFQIVEIANFTPLSMNNELDAYLSPCNK